MAYSNRIAWEKLRSVDTSTSPFSTGVYTNLGTPLLFPSYICKLVNNSNVLVTISTDGINDMDVSPGGSFWLYDESKVGIEGAFPALPAGTQIMIKGPGSAGAGLIYLVSQYIFNI
jgi:hypothetical protein